METTHRFTAVIEREDDAYVALCPELDIASQGATIPEAKENLQEAVELFLANAPDGELKRRLRSEVYITQLEVGLG